MGLDRHRRGRVGGGEDGVEQARKPGIEVLTSQRGLLGGPCSLLPDDAGLAQNPEVVRHRRLRHPELDRAAGQWLRGPGQFAHDLEALRVAQRMQHGWKLELGSSRVVKGDRLVDGHVRFIIRRSSNFWYDTSRTIERFEGNDDGRRQRHRDRLGPRRSAPDERIAPGRRGRGRVHPGRGGAGLNPVTASKSALGRNSNALLLVVCLGQFMVILDVSIVNVALPSIKDALGFSTNGLQWVLNAYTLTFAGFLLLGGRAADLFGRRRMFVAGTLLFSGASLLCAIAPSSETLVAARAVQGIGGAVISPATLAIITTSFDEGAPRNRALGAWGAIGAIGATSGVLLGGVLTEAFDWPAIFLINLPIGAVVVLLSRRVVPEGRGNARNRHFDLLGAMLVTLGMTAVTYGIVTTDRLAWGSLGVVAPLAAGSALLLSFAVYEGRVASEPLMPLSVFRLRTLRAANLVI